MFQKILVLSFVLLFSCGKSDKKTANDKEKDGVSGREGLGSCEAYIGDETSGGCRVRLALPASCDLVTSDTFTFEWTTDGTNCETPWKLVVAGDPVADDNVFEFSINKDPGRVSNTGGIVDVNVAELKQIKTKNGKYHWTVKSFYGSHPASRVFFVK